MCECWVALLYKNCLAAELHLCCPVDLALHCNHHSTTGVLARIDSGETPEYLGKCTVASTQVAMEAARSGSGRLYNCCARVSCNAWHESSNTRFKFWFWLQFCTASGMQTAAFVVSPHVKEFLMSLGYYTGLSQNGCCQSFFCFRFR